ncbi:MAG: hypothetical protein A2Y40_08240 [Candidatus Margulisbacteria bacterium GWF2_35_9]|nr:MAG: hypothetical protein A2Y40_08240 [Candidatus Margulisbacteria bacterium GWF2_35_9]
MVNIQGQNINNLINSAVYKAVNNAKASANTGGTGEVTAEVIYNLFFKDVKSKAEFKKKIRKTLKKLNQDVDDEDIETILDSLDMDEQPPFCASYSEEGVSRQLNLKDALLRADVYDIFLMFYKDIYNEASKKIS